MVEHIFGVLKQKFWILLLPTEYDMEIQARLPAVLSAIHNFTRDHDPEISEDKGPNIVTIWTLFFFFHMFISSLTHLSHACSTMAHTLTHISHDRVLYLTLAPL